MGKFAGWGVVAAALLGLLLVVTGAIRKNSHSATDRNERMRSLYFLPACMVAPGFVWGLAHIAHPTIWTPRWLTQYATSFFAMQLLAYALFALFCRRAIKQQPQSAEATGAQISGMLRAQVIAVVALLGWEVFNTGVTWAPYFGKTNEWHAVLYVASFLYGVCTLTWWGLGLRKKRASSV